ncbi:NADPH-dependent FMN reductase [Aureibacter tunicatorum]|uniref:NAD(P)H-dependent FMN reductase n=1 Tax=Aureibacter tunicatorum TaxID=866807 RepID=A0AAE3XNT8_9BACT|nr:NAD(P)H-dependent oxidoreductase [Aureibacter tunicatorum]MDR6239309.1 NAD(P)H-dependent FMN reductase [Aureibacter tunicatorum]BDD04767.1 FMN reductase [Aureibacter tunicatorum]
MKKIIAFGATNSKESINKSLAAFTANQLENIAFEILDLNDFEMPIYSIDKENEEGIHPLALAFKEKISSADGIIISFAEHNGIFTSAYKNIYDWISRIDQNVWENKPMMLMATSPGQRGGKSVLDFAVNMYSYMNQNTITRFSLPSFHQNFDPEKGITEESLRNQHKEQLNQFESAILSQKEEIKTVM